ncbi:hypothetical protein J1605_000859 [Eschrichtius robustus]|uniref:Anoctamin dimerisation domain-containing protein n=1 Tax=Eschrichtius robustus TaxID=9764 RepID=A0AB34GPU5_ESCRO|nr:hypothetical protein J1605_000859 [Eschrichtius robustus]
MDPWAESQPESDPAGRALDAQEGKYGTGASLPPPSPLPLLPPSFPGHSELVSEAPACCQPPAKPGLVDNKENPRQVACSQDEEGDAGARSAKAAAQASRALGRRWRRGQGPEDDRLCASRGSICVPDSGGNFFRDWKTEIDFLLVREEKLRPPRRAWWQRLLQRSWRDKFQRNLRAAGVLLEEARCNPDSDGGGSYCGAFACCNLCSNTCPISSWTFRRSKLDLFLGRASHDSYFSSTQRHQVAEILARTIYGKQKRAEMGMARLLTEGVYTAAFPLRELGYLFDHLGTVFFSIFLSFWAMAFLEHWEHKSTTLAHHWDCSDFQEEELTPSSALQAQNSASRSSQRP